MTLKLEGTLDAPLRCIIWHPKVIFLHQFNLWNGQTYAHVGIKGYGQLVAVRTSYSPFKLTMHEIHYDWLVSLQMVLPRLLCVSLVVKALRLYLRDDWFRLDSVQVLMKSVQYEIQQLLWVLLIVVVELDKNMRLERLLQLWQIDR